MNTATEQVKNQLGERFQSLANTSKTWYEFWGNCSDEFKQFCEVNGESYYQLIQKVMFTELIQTYWDSANPRSLQQLHENDLFPEGLNPRRIR